MFKFILFGIGFFLLIEGVIYFLLAHKLKNFFEIINQFSNENIRFFSSLLIIIGLSLIYFALKIYRI